MNPKEIIRDNIIRRRKELGWERKDLAEAYGCDYQYIAAVERGVSGVGGKSFFKFVKTLDTTPEDLLRFPSEMVSNEFNRLWEKFIRLYGLSQKGEIPPESLKTIEKLIDSHIEARVPQKPTK